MYSPDGQKSFSNTCLNFQQDNNSKNYREIFPNCRIKKIYTIILKKSNSLDIFIFSNKFVQFNPSPPPAESLPFLRAARQPVRIPRIFIGGAGVHEFVHDPSRKSRPDLREAELRMPNGGERPSCHLCREKEARQWRGGGRVEERRNSLPTLNPPGESGYGTCAWRTATAGAQDYTHPIFHRGSCYINGASRDICDEKSFLPSLLPSSTLSLSLSLFVEIN